MCQTNNKLIKLRKDRVAYKVERSSSDGWLTPYCYATLKRNEIIEADSTVVNPNREISGGFFHCFINKKEARSETGFWDKLCGNEIVRIVKVTIPLKNNTAYIGNFNELKTICARKIILTDEVV